MTELLCSLLSIPWNNPDKKEFSKLMFSNSQSNFLFKKAISEKVSGSLCYLIKENNLSSLFSQTFIDKLTSEFTTIKALNIFRMESIENVLNMLEKNCIPATIIKGSVLLKHIYPSPGMRAQGDIDIVISNINNGTNIDRRTPRELLYKSGYKPHPSYKNLLYKNNSITIDLHNDFIDSSRISSRMYASKINSQNIYNNGLPWKKGYKHVRIPSWNDHVILSALHSEKHSYRLISGYNDIAWILHKKIQYIDYDTLISKAHRYNTHKSLYVCLKYLKKYFKFPVSDNILTDLDRLTAPTWTERQIYNRITAGKKLGPAGSLLPVFSIQKRTNKLKFLLEMIFPKPEVMKQVTGIRHPFLSWFTYPLRLVQLSIKALIMVFRFTCENISYLLTKS